MPSFRLEHVAITVGSLDRAVDWYREAFGFDEVARSDKPAFRVKVALLRLGDQLLEVFEPYEPLAMPEGESVLETSLLRLGTKHMAIAVDDLAAACEHLRSSGVEFATQVVEGSTSRFLFAKDPDGILIEVIQRR